MERGGLMKVVTIVDSDGRYRNDCPLPRHRLGILLKFHDLNTTYDLTLSVRADYRRPQPRPFLPGKRRDVLFLI